MIVVLFILVCDALGLRVSLRLVCLIVLRLRVVVGL